MKRYTLTCDLKNDPKLIQQYKEHHKNVWPEIKESIINSGIEGMEIYNIGTRLFMVLEVNDNFSFEKKVRMDLENPKVVEWEALMDKYQKAVPIAKPGEKWVLMDKIFALDE